MGRGKRSVEIEHFGVPYRTFEQEAGRNGCMRCERFVIVEDSRKVMVIVGE
jgi:hypothetical protein